MFGGLQKQPKSKRFLFGCSPAVMCGRLLFPAARATLTDKNKALSEDLYLNMPYKDCLGGQDYSLNTDADAPS